VVLLCAGIAAGPACTTRAPGEGPPAAAASSGTSFAERLSRASLGRRSRPALGKSLFAASPALGVVTALGPGAQTGGVLATGTAGALEIAVDGAARPLAGFDAARPSAPAPVRVRDAAGFFDRGGSGRRVALYDGAGALRWSAADANTMAAGDLDGDGAADFVVGMGGRGGVRRLDASGRLIWSREDADVRQVELLDADGGGDLEILHSNRQGAFVLRDARGELIESFETGHPARSFALAPWPLHRPSPHVLERVGDQVRLWTPRGIRAAALPAPIWNEQGRVLAATFAPRRSPALWLAVLDTFPDDAIAVLSVYDGEGRRIYDEVLEEACAALGSVERPGEIGTDLLVGCDGRVWRYALDGPRAADATVAAVVESGDAFGPLRFGDPPERVRARARLLPGHRCAARDCAASRVRIGEREWMLVPEFGESGLEAVTLLGLPEPAEAYASEVRQAWDSLVRYVSHRLGSPDRGARGFPGSERVIATGASDGWRMLATHQWTRGARQVEVGLLTVDDEAPLQYAPYASFSASVRPATAGLPAAPQP
jgi:hypothetical protein